MYLPLAPLLRQNDGNNNNEVKPSNDFLLLVGDFLDNKALLVLIKGVKCLEKKKCCELLYESADELTEGGQ